MLRTRLTSDNMTDFMTEEKGQWEEVPRTVKTIMEAKETDESFRQRTEQAEEAVDTQARHGFDKTTREKMSHTTLKSTNALLK